MKILTIGTIFLFIVFFSNRAISQTWQWVEKIGFNGAGNDYGMDIILDDSLNVYVTGRVKNASNFGSGANIVTPTVYGDRDIFLCKYDNDGNLIWAKRYGGLGSDYGLGLCKGKGGDIIVVGYFESSAIFDDTTVVSSGQYDLFVMSVNSNGIRNWLITGGASSGSATANQVSVDANGSIYITGWFTVGLTVGANTVLPYGNQDGFLLKLTSTGQSVFLSKIGGNSVDEGLDISVSPQNEVFVCGRYTGNSFSGSSLISKGGQDAFLAKYDTLGNLVWVRNGGSSTIDISRSIAFSQTGEVFLGGIVGANSSFGTFNSLSNGLRDIFFARYDSQTGIINHYKTFGSSQTDELYDLKSDNDGNLFFISVIEDTIIFDEDTVNLAGSKDVVFGKLNQDFESSWVKHLTGYTASGIYAHGYAIAVDSLENVYPTGGFLFSIPFDSIQMTSSGSSSDVYFGKVSAELYSNPLNDFVICLGDSINLNPQVSSSGIFINALLINLDTVEYLVQPNCITPSIGTSTLKLNYTDGIDTLTLTSTILVNQLPQSGWIEDSIYKCEDDIIILEIPNYPVVQWETGETSDSIHVVANGFYSVYFENSFSCANVDSLLVVNLPLPIFNLGSDTTICFQSRITLESLNGNGFTYSWNNGADSSSIIVSSSGLYSLTLTDNVGCIYIDSVEITVAPEVNPFLGNDSILCNSANLILMPNDNFDSYLWNDGSVLNHLNINQDGIYWVNVTDVNGCFGSDSIAISFQFCAGIDESEIGYFSYFPNPINRNQDLMIELNSDFTFLEIQSLDNRIISHYNLSDGIDKYNIKMPEDAGIYFLQLYNDFSYTRKILIVQ